VTSQSVIEQDTGSSGLRVTELSPEDPRWAEFAASRDEALPYHHPAWFQMLCAAYPYAPAALGCADDSGRLTGLLPLVRKKSLLAGEHLTSLPNTPVAGPLAADQASLRALLGAAAGQVDDGAARWLQLKSAGTGADGLVAGLGRLTWDPAYVTELPADPEQLRFGSSRNHSAILRAVRKAAKQGVVVREATSGADVRRWYPLYLRTMREHAAPPRPLRQFELMWDLLAPRGVLRLLLAERHAGGTTQLLSGSLFLQHAQTICYAFNGRDPAQLAFRPNDAIHWTAMQDGIAAGYRRYDFGEVSAGDTGLSRFKQKWGAVPVPLYRYHYPRQREVERGALRPGPARRAAESAWRRLPLPVTEFLGGWMCARL
jgi:hypothetical protein